MQGEAPESRAFRVGGLVENGSVQRAPGSLEVTFTLTDYQQTVPVSYTGVLPDLFREGQGVIARGKLDGNRFRRGRSARQARRKLHAAGSGGQPQAAHGCSQFRQRCACRSRGHTGPGQHLITHLVLEQPTHGR